MNWSRKLKKKLNKLITLIKTFNGLLHSLVNQNRSSYNNKLNKS